MLFNLCYIYIYIESWGKFFSIEIDFFMDFEDTVHDYKRNFLESYLCKDGISEISKFLTDPFVIE